MPKSHARYAPEYRRRMIELVRAGRSPDELAKEVRANRAVDTQLADAGGPR
jgi:hypothetical protein